MVLEIRLWVLCLLLHHSELQYGGLQVYALIEVFDTSTSSVQTYLGGAVYTVGGGVLNSWCTC